MCTQRRSRYLPTLEQAGWISIWWVSVVVLCWQLPRWFSGLDPTYVSPAWWQTAAWRGATMQLLVPVHPIVWLVVCAATFVRLAHLYGWTFRLRRRR